MSVVLKVTELATRIAQVIESHRVKIGTLSALTTTQKSNLVASINEVVASVANASSIDDGVTNTSKTWSSSKITSQIASAISTALEGEDLSDLASEITALAQADNGLISAVATQTLTTAQKAQARTNIGAVSEEDIGDTDTNFVTVFDAIYGA